MEIFVGVLVFILIFAFIKGIILSNHKFLCSECNKEYERLANQPEIKVVNDNSTELIKGVSKRFKEDKKKEVERKIFPGYVLIKMIVTDDSWYVVRNIRGCTGFVGPASKPVPLTDDEVAALGVEKHSVEVGYSEGDTVKIISGPLEGYTGTVRMVDTANNSVCVVLSMFGRETPVELELDQITTEE